MFINAQGSRLSLCHIRWTLLFRIRCRCVSLEERKSAFWNPFSSWIVSFLTKKIENKPILNRVTQRHILKKLFSWSIFLIYTFFKYYECDPLLQTKNKKKRVTSEKRIIDKLKKENERKGKRASATATHFSP